MFAFRLCNAVQFKEGSQAREILNFIQQHGSITHYEAAQMGIMGFSSRIAELRAAGFNIVCIMEQHKNKNGRMIKRGRFVLIQAASNDSGV